MRLANLDNQRGNLELLEQRTVCFQKVICLLVAYFGFWWLKTASVEAVILSQK